MEAREDHRILLTRKDWSVDLVQFFQLVDCNRICKISPWLNTENVKICFCLFESVRCSLLYVSLWADSTAAVFAHKCLIIRYFSV